MKARYALTEDQIYEFVQFLSNACDIVPIDQTLPVPIRDVNDIAVLRTAIIGEADVLCTLDSDFYDSGTLAFCGAAGFEVCTDRDLIERLGV